MKKVSLLAILVVCLVSCQKEQSIENPSPPTASPRTLVVDPAPVNLPVYIEPASAPPGETLSITNGENSNLDLSRRRFYDDAGNLINVILLDFDGHTFDGLGWSTEPIVTTGPSGLSSDVIQRVIDSVRKDFKYFPVTITTDESLFNACDRFKRQRLVITAESDWFGTAAGGVAYTGCFGFGDDTPAFIFTQMLNYASKYVAEAASHELGHSLWLLHQSKWENGVILEEYSTGNPGSLYAPIMGMSYYRTGQWIIGRNSYGYTQYDGRTMESILGGRISGTGRLMPFGTY